MLDRLLLWDRGLAPRALREIKAANHIGRLEIRDLELAVALAAGALFGLVQLLNDQRGRDAAHAADRLAQDLLVVYGLSAEEAQELCMRALPDLDDIAVGDAPDRSDIAVAAMPADNGQAALGAKVPPLR